MIVAGGYDCGSESLNNFSGHKMGQNADFSLDGTTKGCLYVTINLFVFFDWYLFNFSELRIMSLGYPSDCLMAKVAKIG